eukprot:1195237-Prorocentrum_minimum.AAC.4
MKKEYNTKYYKTNRIKLNAEKLVKNVKNKDQRCLMATTYDKYKTGFNNNQKLFLDGLIKNCQLERKQLYEMPEPPPILEQPEQPEDIPFVPRLPEQRVFRENRNMDKFTIDEARRVVHINRRVDDGGTEKAYYQKINSIMTKFNLDRENGLWSDVYKAGFDKIVDVLSFYKNPSGYIVVLLYTYERSEKLKAIVDKMDENLYKKLQVEYRESQSREKVANRETKLADKTNYIQHYRDLFMIEEEYSKTQYASQKHIIALLYSKGLFDDNGNLILVPRNYFWNVELVERDSDMLEKPKKTQGSGFNYYNINNGKLYLQSYKTVGKYDAITLILNKYTQKVIMDSYKENKRQWLFLTKFGNRYASNNSFGSQIGESVGITVNQIRRAFINYHLFVEKWSRDKIAKVAGHSVDINELIYSTSESNEALQNVIYDEAVINKKVNVKIYEGKNKGKTLVGVVYRSLKPNRDKFPYVIKFDVKDKEKDEQVTTIPDLEDGITFYEEPTARRKKTTNKTSSTTTTTRQRATRSTTTTTTTNDPRRSARNRK